MTDNKNGGTSKEADPSRRTYNILVFGAERVGLLALKSISRSNYKLKFEPYSTPSRFNDFDAVITFQGIFEKVDSVRGSFDEHHTRVVSDKAQLDKRYRELQLLLEKGGFVCFVLREPFIDQARFGDDASTSDLAKIELTFSHFYRKNFSERVPAVHPKRNEFIRFLKLHGAAWSYFDNHNTNTEFISLATVGQKDVGYVVRRNSYFVPSQVPENRPEIVEEYFDLLAEAVTSTANKLAVELPDWINTFQFVEERVLLERKKKIEAEVLRLDQTIERYEKFKRILATGDDSLVSDVSHVLREGLGFLVDDRDEYREDLKIVDDKNNPLVFVEVKGVNTGVKLEHVNQADSHRERAGFPPTFPAVLVINTHIKNARTLAEKDKPIGSDQIDRAVRIGVVLLRTVDLLALLELVAKGSLSKSTVLDLFKSPGGWLRVWGLDAPTMVTKAATSNSGS